MQHSWSRQQEQRATAVTATRGVSLPLVKRQHPR